MVDKRQTPKLGPYLLALAATAAMSYVRYVLAITYGDARPLLPFMVAVVVSAYVGGLGPGLLATLLGAALGNFFSPALAFKPPDGAPIFAYTGAYILVGAVTSLLSEWMHEARRKLETAVQERQRAEEALRFSEERFRSTLQHSPVILSSQDTELRFTWIFNLPVIPAERLPPHRSRMLTEDDFLGQTDAALFPAHEAETLMTLKRESLACGERRRTELSFGAGDLARVYDVVVDPFRDETGKVVGVNSVALEVTERSQTQEALRLSEARMRSIFEANTIGLVYGQKDGTILGANDKFLELVGYTREDLEAAKINAFALTPPEHLARSQETQRQVQVEGRAAHYEKEFVRKDGTRTSVLVGKTLLEPGGDLTVAFVLDLTQLKQTEAQLSAANTRLTAALVRERNIAVALQRALTQMPAPDAFPGLQVSAVYEPAWEESDVGGDFTDAFLLGESRVAVVVGDVSGKGLSATARTAEIKYTLRGMLYERGSPAAALTGLNEYLCDTLPPTSQSGEEFVCLSVAIVEASTGQLTISTGGTEPPLCVRSNGSLQEVAVRGTPLGIFAEMQYQDEQLELGHGDLLVLVSDGVTEARRGDEFFGYEGMAQAVARMRHTPMLADLTGGLVREAQTFAGGALHDDACVLALRRV